MLNLKSNRTNVQVFYADNHNKKDNETTARINKIPKKNRRRQFLYFVQKPTALISVSFGRFFQHLIRINSFFTKWNN